MINLFVDKSMTKQQYLDGNIYTTGAYLRPLYIEETKKWVWVVVDFDGDSFACDGDSISLDTEADCEEGLIKDEDNND